MESPIAPDPYLAAFLTILEDISVKLCRGHAPEPLQKASANYFCFKLTPPALISFRPPKQKYAPRSLFWIPIVHGKIWFSHIVTNRAKYLCIRRHRPYSLWSEGTWNLTIVHFTVVCLVTWPLRGSETGVDLVLMQISCFSYVNETS